VIVTPRRPVCKQNPEKKVKAEQRLLRANARQPEQILAGLSPEAKEALRRHLQRDEPSALAQ
jgi:hypothetical protein